MNVGVIKEIKKEENRVALQPYQVKILTDLGHKVYIEDGAGNKSNYSNAEYSNYGAIISTKSVILNSCKLLLKVKAPLESEYNDYSERHILFTYLHFDENIQPHKIYKLINSRFLGIAYEWVELNNDYPLLRPMSKLTGYLFAQKSLEFLARHKGKLAGAYESYIKPSHALIIGLGTIGLSAFKYYYDNNLKITVVDKNPHKLKERFIARFGKEEGNKLFSYNYEIIKFEENNSSVSIRAINKIIGEIDILLNCAVRRPNLDKEKLTYLITREMVNSMMPGSVVSDTTGCDKDLVETCISSESLEEYEIINGIIHYNCDHIPSLVGNTASNLLTEQTFPYILKLANEREDAIYNNEPLKAGASCYLGKVTHEYTAKKKGLEYFDIITLLKDQ